METAEEYQMKPHSHVDEHGILHKCYHQCRNTLLSISFWLGVTLSFPIEHFLWEKIWPFTILSKTLGL